MMSKRLQANFLREQREMAKVVHTLGFEVFKDVHFGGTSENNTSN
jgi:hypothetical protein